jgi:hypothetical protein
MFGSPSVEIQTAGGNPTAIFTSAAGATEYLVVTTDPTDGVQISASGEDLRTVL